MTERIVDIRKMYQSKINSNWYNTFGVSFNSLSTDVKHTIIWRAKMSNTPIKVAYLTKDITEDGEALAILSDIKNIPDGSVTIEDYAILRTPTYCGCSKINEDKINILIRLIGEEEVKTLFPKIKLHLLEDGCNFGFWVLMAYLVAEKLR